MPDKDLSMFTTVERVVREIEAHDGMLEDHTLQLRVQAVEIKQLQENATKLENVIMAENHATRVTITQTNQQLHELINGIMGFKTGQSQITQQLKMARWESIAKIIGILAGSGGILYYIFG